LAPGRAPLRPASRELDGLAGKRSGHEHHTVRRFDDRVAAAADSANLTFDDSAFVPHQRSTGSAMRPRFGSRLIR
jgi:hypothetical protein